VLLRIVWDIHIHYRQNVEFEKMSQDGYVLTLFFVKWLLNAPPY